MIRTKGHLKGLGLLLLCWSCLIQAEAPRQIEQIQQLARAGANTLALKQLDAELQNVEFDSAYWMTLKREQIKVMRSHGSYSELAELLAVDIKKTAVASNQRWLLNQQIEAFLAAGDSELAIRYLRNALWSNASSTEPEVLDAIANWRRQLVEARMLAGQYDLAADTLARYENDYQLGSDAGSLQPGIQRWPWPYQPRFNQELQRSRARLFVDAGQLNVVANLLAKDEHPSVQLIRLAALLRTGGIDAAEVYQRAIAMTGDKSLGLPERKSAWVLAGEAANKQGQLDNEVAALKQAMVTAPDLPFAESLLALSYAQSWQKLQLAGSSLLSNGRFNVAATVEQLNASSYPVNARQAVMAALYNRSEDDAEKSRLLAGLIELETDDQVRRQLLPGWILQNEHVDTETLSPALRYQLVDLLLGSGEVNQAAELLARLDEAPSGVSNPSWQLRRARVLVLAAKAEAGIVLLHQLQDGEFGPMPDLDRYLQAVFDVQAVGEQQAAIELFQRLLAGELSPRHRRELHYWLADAAKADGQYGLAAEHYLRSAGEAGNSWDQWGISARRQAAAALQDGEFFSDAVNVYQRLLDHSTDRTDRAVLTTNIQRLKAQL